jgi:hypothetical protein
MRYFVKFVKFNMPPLRKLRKGRRKGNEDQACPSQPSPALPQLKAEAGDTDSSVNLLLTMTRKSPRKHKDAAARKTSQKRKATSTAEGEPAAVVVQGEAAVGEAKEADDEAVSEGLSEVESEPQKKKSKQSSSKEMEVTALTDEQEGLLVDLFMANPIFYDQSLPGFKRRSHKDFLLTRMGKEVGTTGE